MKTRKKGTRTMPKLAAADIRPVLLPRTTSSADDDRLLDVDQAAEILGVKRGTLFNWVSRSRIEYVRVGRLVKFTRAGLRRYIARNTAVPRD